MLIDQQAKWVTVVAKALPKRQRKRWVAELSKQRPGFRGQSYLHWLKQSPRTRRGQGLAGAFERIHFLLDLQVHSIELPPMPLALIKAHANRTARLKLTRFNRLRAESQTVGLTCYLQLTLWRTTDEAIEAWLMRVSEVRRSALERGSRRSSQDWQERHGALLSRVSAIAKTNTDVSAGQAELLSIVQSEEGLLKLSRAEQTRATLVEMNAQVRTLLRLMVALPINISVPDAWLTRALPLIRDAYARRRPELPPDASLEFLPNLWRRHTEHAESAQQLRILEAATLLQLQGSLRNGSAVMPTSLSYQEHESLLIPKPDWVARRGAHLQLLDCSRSVYKSVERILPAVSQALTGLAREVRRGTVTITADRGVEMLEPLRLSDQEDDELEQRVKNAFVARVGSIELPRLLMEIDAQVRFSSALLRRVPSDQNEVIAVYGALLAHGMGLDRIQILRMMRMRPGMSS